MFYDRFFELCQKEGVTPANVADAIGINKSTVYMWKKQGTTPKYETIRRLAEYFGVTIDDLLTEKEQVNAVVANMKTKLEKIKRRTELHLELLDNREVFLKIYDDYLNDHGKREVHKYTEYLITKQENLKQGVPLTKPPEDEGDDEPPTPK